MALPHIGSWGLPDFGITEKIGDLMGASRTYQGGSNIRPYQTDFSGTVNYANLGNGGLQPTGQVQGANTYQPSGGGGGQPQQQQSIMDSVTDNTQNHYQNLLSNAQGLYDHRAAELNNQLGGLGREKDSLLDRIGSTYGGLVQTAQDTLTKNLGALDNRRGEVNQQYDVSRTNVGRLLMDQQRMNRVLARSQGTLGSSYYGNLQTDAGRDATQRVAGLNTEEQSKLDAIGDAIVNAQTDTNTKIQSLEEAKGHAETEIINKYQTMANSIRNDLRFNERDRLDALDAVNNRMASALDNIQLTMMQYSAMASGLGNTANQWTNQIQSFDPFGQIQGTLDNSESRMASYSPFQSPVAAPQANAANQPTGYYNFGQNRQPSLLDQLFA